jgi:prepilin-type N-terminal cleavage/methylation domain-containing protein
LTPSAFRGHHPPGSPSVPPGDRGFTLIELMIVVLLIGILASIAVYGYKHMVSKARMTQAQVVLKHLHKTEVMYYSDTGRYTDNLDIISYDPVKYSFYDVSVTLDNASQDYIGAATGKGPMAGDRWTITNRGPRGGIPEQDNAAKLMF